MTPISRRQLLARGGALMCACHAGARFAYARGAKAPTDAPALDELPYGAVQLAAGPMLEQFDHQQRHRSRPREWTVSSTAVPIRLRPFMAITNETYRLHSRLAPA